MNVFRWICLLLLVVSGAGTAANPKSQELWLHGRISIDAEGRVADLAWDRMQPLQTLVAGRITAQVKACERNGVRVPFLRKGVRFICPSP